MLSDTSTLVLRFVHLGSFGLLLGCAITTLAVVILAQKDTSAARLEAVLSVLLRVDKYICGPSAFALGMSGLLLTLLIGTVAFKTLWILLLFLLWLLGASVVHKWTIPQLKQLHQYTKTHIWLDADFHDISNAYSWSQATTILILLAALFVALWKPTW